MTSDFRHSFASEEEWAALEPVLEDGFSAFFSDSVFLSFFLMECMKHLHP